MTLRVSVVVSNYNYRRYLGEALDAALSQTRPPDELIVVDDGSSDDSLAFLAAAYGQCVQLRVISQANGGQLRALIAGTRAATGALLFYLDADDVWEPDYLARVIAEYERDPELDFVYVNLRLFGQREGLWLAQNRDHDHGLTVLETRYGRHWIGAPTSALSMRRHVALRALDVPETLHDDWRGNADDVLIYGSSIAGARKRYLAQPLVRYRAHGSNLWLGDSSHSLVRQTRRDFAVRRLLAHFGRLYGVDQETLPLIKREFQTKPRPTRAELRIARQLSGQAPDGWGKRFERWFALWRVFHRARRRLPRD